MVSRRNFLKFGALGMAGTPLALGTAAPARAEELQHGGQDFSYLSGTKRKAIPTACALCASRCAAIGYVENGYVVKVEGQPESQRTLGTLCAKGQAATNQVYDPDRILQPLKRTGKRGEGKWQKISWDAALDELTAKLKKLRDDGQPEKFMFHHGWISASADRLINKVFLPSYGTATVADNSCLGQSGRRTALELTWGGRQDNWDFDNARYVLNFGSNVMEAHTNHVALARRLAGALADGNLKMTTFDVRLSNTASKSSTWIQIRPGTDAAVVLALCHVIMAEDLYRGAGEAFLEFCQVTPDPNVSLEAKVAALNEHLADYTPEWAEEISGVGAEHIIAIAREFSTARPACVISSRGASAHYGGVETERAIQMLAAITGNIDNPGGRCLGIVPQWIYPEGPEDKPAARKLDILSGPAGEVVLPVHGVGHQVLRMIKDGAGGRPEVYMWYNYNPVYSNANIAENRDILIDETLLPYTVAVTPFYDESAALADLILPDAVFLETYDFEDGISPTQVPEYYIRQPVVPPHGEARDFKDVCCELAARMDFPLGFDTAKEFVDQACSLTPEVEENGDGFEGMVDAGVLYDPEATPAYHTYRGIVAPEALQEDGVILDTATGVYWNWMTVGVASGEAAARLGYRRTAGAYKGYVGQMIWGAVYEGFRPDALNKSGYFEIYSPILAEKDVAPMPTYMPAPEHEAMKEEQLLLTTFKVNVQTLSRTQNCRWLAEIDGDDAGWINPATAAERGIADGDRIKLATGLGTIEATVKVTENVVPGVIAMSSHGGRWQYGRYASGEKAPFAIDRDAPHEALKWWTHDAQHPNWIIDIASEPISGQQRWMDTVVSVSKI